MKFYQVSLMSGDAHTKSNKWINSLNMFCDHNAGEMPK